MKQIDDPLGFRCKMRDALKAAEAGTVIGPFFPAEFTTQQ